MAAPTLLGQNDWARYGVDPNTSQYDLQNNRYNTNQTGTYLYHGDVGGNNVGWYAASERYDPNNPSGTPGTPSQPNPYGPGGTYNGTVDPSLRNVSPASGQPQGSKLPYSPSIPLGPTSQSLGTASPQNPLNDAVRSRLMDLLGTNINQVSTTDPDVAPASRAYAARVQQEAQGQREQALEQANQEGTVTGGATQAHLANIGQTAAQAIGANDAALIQQKQQQRIDQLKTGISVASSMGMNEEANNLQRQLANLQAQTTERGQDVTQAGQQIHAQIANLDAGTKMYLGNLDAQLRREGYSEQDRLGAMDAEVRRLGINTQGNLGQLDIALRQELGIGQLNLGLLGTLFGNQQANNTLGFNYADLIARMNQSAVGWGGG